MARPDSLEEAVSHLIAVLSDRSKDLIRSTAEDDLILFHHGWGTGIRNEFGLHGKNDQLLRSCGATHADEASMVIMKAV